MGVVGALVAVQAMVVAHTTDDEDKAGVSQWLRAVGV